MISKRLLHSSHPTFSIHSFHLSSSASSSSTPLLESLSHFHRSLENYPNSVPSYSSCNTLIDNLRKAKHYDHVISVHSKMRNCVVLDRVSYNTVINGLCKGKRFVEARDLFEEMKVGDCKPNSVTFSALIDGFCKDGRVEEGFGLLEDMEKMGLEADVFVYSSLI
ncbi:pentatricopeptide repeat-containing protein, partial [Trifolium pratense]